MKNIYIILLSIISSIPAIAQHTDHFEMGISVRNKELIHYHDMVSWEDSTFKEFAYYTTNSTGSIIDFMNFRVMFPEGYDRNADVKYPTTFMLHGAGESGRKWTDHFEYEPDDERYDNNGHQLLIGGKAHRDAILDMDEQGRSFPGIAIYPQCSYNGAWNGNNLVMSVKIIEYMIREYDVDPYRIYLHGLSNGGKGTWDFATLRPDLFAAILPMAGMGTDIEASIDSLVTTPVWAFQGENDTNPSQSWTEQWINGLKAKGGNPKYTLYEGVGHDPTFYMAYEEADFFSWMLQNDKRDIYTFNDAPECVNEQDTVKLGFSAGYLGYQWKRDGNPINGATNRYYTASLGGTYTVEFKQKTDSSWVESKPIFLDGVSTGDQPVITANGSTAQPVTLESGWNLGLTLSVPDTLYEYRWFKDGQPISGSGSEIIINPPSESLPESDAGVYVLEYGQESNCSNNLSTPIAITYTDPQPTANPPSGLIALPDSENSIELTWSDTDYEVYYEVWSRRIDTKTDTSGYPGTNFTLISKPDANATSLTKSDLLLGTQHEFKVRAIRPDCSATFSESITAGIVDTTPPTTPTLEIDSVGETVVVLSWEASTDNDFIYRYELYQDNVKIAHVTSEDNDPSDGFTPPPTSYTVQGLENTTEYEFGIKSVDYARNESTMSTISVETIEILQAHQFTEREYTLFPNPTSGMLNLNAANTTLNQTKSAVIYSHSGALSDKQKLLYFIDGKASVDISNLPRGHYFIRIDDKVFPVIKE